MTVDVANTITGSGNAINHGSRIVSVNKFGTTQKITPKIDEDLTPEQLETKLTDKFDDPRYYQGDTDA
jgi:hypothetical protein